MERGGREGASDHGSERRPLPTGVVTFCLTDIEGSTARWDADPDAMAQTLAAHDESIDRIVTSHGGTLLKQKGEGDATLSVFGRASWATQAARAIVAATADLGLAVRVALHTGEAFERDGDYFGPTLNRAARLRGLACGGEVLLSRTTADLVREYLPEGTALEDRGSHLLKGLTRPEDVFALADRRAEVAPTRREKAPLVPLPRPLAAQQPMAGRAAALDRLRSQWRTAVEHGGSPSVALVSGEPGIGKTRLVSELAREVHAGGGAVFYGRCDEDVVVPYQPFAEVLRAVVAVTPDLAPSLGRRSADLARIVPEIGVASAPSVDAELDRAGLFAAVVDALRFVADEHPTLLVLDDLHWASGATLALLRHVLRSMEATPLLVVGTYRDTELDRRHPLADTLRDLHRDASVDRIPLRGLDETEVEQLVATLGTGVSIDVAVARALHEETQGNPFFVTEVLRHLADAGPLTAERLHDGLLDLPQGVKDVVSRRLDRLAPEAAAALTIAAVAGAQFRLRVLESVPGVVDPLAALDEAVAAALVVEEGAGRFAFAHALVRQTLLSDLTTTRRVRLHRQIGEAIESLPDADHHVEDLAFHFFEAATDGQAEKAARYALEAGRRATARAGAAEAGPILERGLEALALVQEPDLGLRCDLRLALVQPGYLAEWAYDDEGRRTTLAAADDARRLGDATRFARAAMTYRGGVGIPDVVGLELRHEALDLVGPDDPIRAPLLSDVADYLQEAHGEAEQAAAVRAEALVLARRHGDREALAATLTRTIVSLWGTPQWAESEELVAELEAVTATLPRQHIEAVGNFRALRCLERGDVAGYHTAVDEARRLAAVYGLHGDAEWLGNGRAMVALLAGDFAEAEALNEMFASASTGTDAFSVFAANLYLIRRAQGRIEELLSVFPVALESAPGLAAFRAAMALSLVELGDAAEAQAIVDTLAADDFADVARNQVRLVTLCVLAEACALLGDTERATRLYELLQPHGGSAALVMGGDICVGAVDRYLGILAATVGDAAEAQRRFEAALVMDRDRLGSPPNHAWTAYWYARSLGRRDQAAIALEIAEGLGMVRVAAESRALLGVERSP